MKARLPPDAGCARTAAGSQYSPVESATRPTIAAVGSSMALMERNRERAETRRRIRAVVIAIGASVVVSATELSLGWFLGLRSLQAEGIHCLLDAVDSVIVLIAVLIAARPADRSHQFGHGKFEALGATVEASFVLVAGVGIAYSAIVLLIRQEAPERIPLYVSLVMIAAAVFYFIVSVFLMREARETKSPALLAEALHLRTHIYVAGGVGLGLLAGSLGEWPVADSILALIVAICLIVISGRIFREVLNQFTDAALPPEEIETLAGIVKRFDARFIEVHGLRTRLSGADRQIQMHVTLRPETTVAAAHQLCDDIEEAICSEWPTSNTTVHIEPERPGMRVSQPWIRGQPALGPDGALTDAGI
jgi:cation diffusion facilitator family transporter